MMMPSDYARGQRLIIPTIDHDGEHEWCTIIDAKLGGIELCSSVRTHLCWGRIQ